MNWNEQILSNGTRWVAGWNKKCYEILRIREANGKWTIDTKKGPSRRKLRRVTTFCHKDLSKTKAVQITKRILQDHVLGRLN